MATEKNTTGRPNFNNSGRESVSRYYVYTGSMVSEWLDYDDLDVAIRENPTELVFDRTTREAVPETYKNVPV